MENEDVGICFWISVALDRYFAVPVLVNSTNDFTSARHFHLIVIHYHLIGMNFGLVEHVSCYNTVTHFTVLERHDASCVSGSSIR